MPAKPRPPMPKLPPFALMNDRPPRKAKPQHLTAFFLVFAIPLVLFHLGVLSLPYFWDELGQFIPSALDILRSGAIVPHSALPNVHPPAVAAYLALCFKIFGYSIPVTRLAMLTLASFGVLFTFMLAVELSKGTKGAPAFLPPIFLLVSPLFFTQSMLAQLDMPAMVFTLLALLLFVKRQYAWSALACVVLVLVKETGAVVPAVFLIASLARVEWKRAGLFAIPLVALGAWLLFLHEKTGYWLGDPEFARYNVSYALHPVRISISLARRLFYLFVAEMRWIGTLVLFCTVFSCKAFHRRSWKVVAGVVGCTILLVSMFGGAELERYLLPVLPLFYIAVAVGISALTRPFAIAAAAGTIVSLIFFVIWNPPYPFPFENNYAMVDFVHLQQLSASYAERNLRDRRIATAWPYSASLRNPDLGFVQRRLQTLETKDLHFSTIQKLPPGQFDTLITYTRESTPQSALLQNEFVRRFLQHFYQWEPDITPEQCAELGLEEKISWTERGQTTAVFFRKKEHGQ